MVGLNHRAPWRYALMGLALVMVLVLARTSWAEAAASSPSSAPVVSADSLPSTVETGEVNTGDTAWMLVSSALVMVMMPGLALFYAGMVRRKNVLGTMMHSMAVLGIIGLEWVIIGYAMAFGQSKGFIGWDPKLLFLQGVEPGHLHKGTKIPELVFVMFQGMFAIITPALISGAYAERIKFKSFCFFTLLWGLVVYNPLCHWVWAPGGWLGTQGGIGALDFAGGTVVHISAGVSALVVAMYVGKRMGYPASVLQPNSLTLTFLGAGLLWFGWFGFNGGSALGSNGSAAGAFAATQIAAAAGAMAWMFAEWIKHGRPTTLGVASGLVAGLVAITPASGFVAPWAAIIIGLAAGLVCYGAVLLKGKLGYDDSLDAFGVHGVGGFLGALLTGVFAVKAFGGTDGGAKQVLTQLTAAGTAAGYAAIVTLVLVFVIDKLMGFRLSSAMEIEGLDVGVHGEQGWMLDATPIPAAEYPGNQSVDIPSRKQDTMGVH
jgi:ammonium transporter, Amt family